MAKPPPHCPYASCVHNRGLREGPRPYRCKKGIGTKRGTPCREYKPVPWTNQYPRWWNPPPGP